MQTRFVQRSQRFKFAWQSLSLFLAWGDYQKLSLELLAKKDKLEGGFADTQTLMQPIQSLDATTGTFEKQKGNMLTVTDFQKLLGGRQAKKVLGATISS